VEGQKDEFGKDRHHGNIAHELAGRDPAAAERVFALLKHPERFAARVCYRMAPKDLPRARAIAATKGVGATTRAWCLAVMAIALTDAAPAQARAMCDEACAAAMAAKVPEIAAALLPSLQRLDPDAVPDCIARLLAARPADTTESFRSLSEEANRRCLLALQLRAFDGEVADALAEPAWQWASAVVLQSSGAHSSWRSAALFGWLDPVRTRSLVDAWPCPDQPKMLDESTMPRLSLAKVLGLPVAERLAELLKSERNLWIIDEEDL
ncbi:MAG TPA: hypothetical protein VFT55_01395, partial [Planctomycetota bacterium]|nr:hypothetical protein [Planctomycetota bacterium]